MTDEQTDVQEVQTEEVTFSEAQQAKIDEIIQAEKAKAKKSATKDMFTAEDVANEVSKQLEAAKARAEEERKVAEMSEKDKKNYENEQLQKQLADLQAERDALKANALKAQLTNEAAKILADKGVAADERTLKFVVKGTADETTEAIDDFISLINDKAEVIRQAGLTGRTPRSNAGSNVKTYSKADFMKLTTSQKSEYRRNNPEAYEQIMSQF